jgi:uncharacterized membrane protein YhhN
MMLSEHQVPDRTIAYGLIVSSMGDASLWLETADGVADNLREPLFMIGLVCFLVAHILYIKAMLGHTSFHTKWLSLPIFVYYTTMMYVILPAAPEELGLPIMIYGLAISVMGYAALNFWHNCVSPAWQKNAVLGLVGALFFIISDTILALAKFVPAYKAVFQGYHQEAVMGTYYIGQLLIARSCMFDAGTGPAKNSKKKD